jgi:hypothetical protein
MMVDPSKEARQAEFRRLFHKEFDGPQLGSFVLGRISRIMTPQQRQDFLALFEAFVVATYSERLSDYVAGRGAPRVIGTRSDPGGLSSLASSAAVRADSGSIGARACARTTTHTRSPTS